MIDYEPNVIHESLGNSSNDQNINKSANTSSISAS